jgi:hypothetical protein
VVPNCCRRDSALDQFAVGAIQPCGRELPDLDVAKVRDRIRLWSSWFRKGRSPVGGMAERTNATVLKVSQGHPEA